MAAGDVTAAINNTKARAGAKFDGVDDLVEVTNTKELEATTEMSLSLWCFPYNSGQLGAGKLASKPLGWRMLMDGQNVNFRIQISGAKNATSTGSAVTYKKWHHIAGVYDGANVLLYVDNVKFTGDAATGQIDANTDNVVIGNLNNPGIRAFNGVISDVRLYNKALTAAEVALLFGDSRVKRGLVSEWLLKDNYNDTAGSNHGANSGSALATVEETIAAAIKAARVTANDIYLLSDSDNGIQATFVHIEET